MALCAAAMFDNALEANSFIPLHPYLLDEGFKAAILPDEVMYPDCIVMGLHLYSPLKK